MKGLDRLDSATLRGWRVGNVVGWVVGAACLAMVLQVAVDAIVSISFTGRGIDDLTFSPSPGLDAPVWVKHLLRAGLSVGLGMLIGGIVAARVWRAPTVAAAISATLYAVAAIVLIELYPAGVLTQLGGTGTGLLVRTVLYEVAIVITIPSAWWWAKR